MDGPTSDPARPQAISGGHSSHQLPAHRTCTFLPARSSLLLEMSDTRDTKSTPLRRTAVTQVSLYLFSSDTDP